MNFFKIGHSYDMKHSHTCLTDICMYQCDKKDIRKIFKDATSLGLELGYDLDSIVNNQTKSRIMQIYMDDEHFMQEFLERCPSGRLRHPKYRTAWGKDCFLRHMCIYINKTVF